MELQIKEGESKDKEPTLEVPPTTAPSSVLSPPDLHLTRNPLSPVGLTIRQLNAQKLLYHFSKTFVSLIESTIFSKTDGEGDEDEAENDETDEYFDNFERYASYNTLEQRQNLSYEEFFFEKYFGREEKEHFRDMFVTLAFSIFRSYEYQLIMLVKEKRKIGEIAEDIVHRILDNFKESQRGCNPDFIKPEITTRFLIELALQHTEPEGIQYNSEWSAVEILENPGILFPKKEQEKVVVQDDVKQTSSTSIQTPPMPGSFFQSDWQKNFIGVKKKIGSKYGFRLNFDFETERSIMKNFERVPFSSVSPLYLQYKYCLSPQIMGTCRDEILREFLIEDKMKKFGITEEKGVKDKVKEFQMKLQIEKQMEDRNSDKVMKQVIHLGQRERLDKVRSKVEKLQSEGVIKYPEEVEKCYSGLLKANYNVRFEIKEQQKEVFP